MKFLCTINDSKKASKNQKIIYPQKIVYNSSILDYRPWQHTESNPYSRRLGAAMGMGACITGIRQKAGHKNTDPRAGKQTLPCYKNNEDLCASL
jgi:hypothetical protein